MTSSSSVTEYTWSDIRGEVKKINPELTAIIDAIGPAKKFKLYKAQYRFGDYILRNGELFLPEEQGRLLSLVDADTKLKKALGYSKIPLFLTLKNCNEVFIDTGERAIPLNFVYPGSLLGLFEVLDKFFDCKNYPKWSVTAGARSMFMLPKINRLDGFKRLRAEYQLKSTRKIQTLADHWEIFRDIARHSEFSEDWTQEVLFFSEEWFQNMDDAAWFPFQRYLFGRVWKSAQINAGKLVSSLSWETFISTVSARGLRPNPYIADQIKHLISITNSKWPAFRPAVDSECAPVKGIQAAFEHIYLLKEYIPTLMHAAFLDEHMRKPVYYSLSFPTLFEGSPHDESSATRMLILRDIKIYLSILVASIHKNKLVGDFLSDVEFSYFHVEADKEDEILSSTEIPEGDPAFLQSSNGRIFCYTSPFWRGTIRIRKK